MGSYKLGAECCNNCVYWEAERDDKHGKENVYSYKNYAKCMSSHSPSKGRTTLAKNVCPYFSHIWGITKTFSISEDSGASTVSGGSTTASGVDSLTSAYMEGVMGSIKASYARQKCREEEEQQVRKHDREVSMRREETRSRNYEILVQNGMDPDASPIEQTAFEILYRDMVDGDAQARYEMGLALLYGKDGAVKDESLAFTTFKRASAMEHVEAIYMTGYCYYFGKGVAENNESALAYFTDAAFKGSVNAQYRRAECYQKGFGTKEDLWFALDCYKKALDGGHDKAKEGIFECIAKLQKRAEDGDANSMKQLGMIYYSGEVVEKDYLRARDWLSKAARGGSECGMTYLGEMWRDGEGGDKSLSNALYWFMMAAQKGYKRANENLEKLSADEIRKAFVENPVHTAKLLEFVGEAFFKDDATQEQKKEMKAMVEGASTGSSVAYLKLAKVFWSKQSMCVKNSAVARVFSMAGIANAQDAESCFLLGEYYFNGWVVEKDKKEAFKWYLKAAEQNNSDAQNMAGRCYQCGWGCDVDYEKAFMYFDKAAEQNDLVALNNLAVMYENGQGCQKDVKKARELFAKAVAGDFSRAAYHLGRFCENGIGGDRDVSEAVKLYGKAAAKGDGDALVALAEIYLKGKDDVEQDMGKAVDLLEEAADNKERPSAKSRAKALLGECYEYGWGVDDDDGLSEVEAGNFYEEAAEDEECALGCYNYARFLEDGLGVIDQDHEKALYYYRKAAEQEYVKAYCKIGDFYFHGRAVEKDEKEAFKWYSKAAEQNDPAAQNKLGFFYLNGRGGVEKDYSEAFRYFKMSAENGDAIGQREMGNAFGLGRGVEKNYGEAFKWFLKSAEKGDANAQINIGDFYKTGKGVDVDYTKALMWYEKALDKCGAKAKLKIGQLYLDGKGVEKDEAKAFSLLKESAEDGDGMAMAFCGLLCRDGRGTVSNKEKAFEWFRKSAEKGVLNGKLCLARAYRNGDGVVQQLGKAKELFEELAEKGNPRGCYYLGDMLEKGEGGEVDIEKAKTWYEKAAATGDKDAKAALERLG